MKNIKRIFQDWQFAIGVISFSFALVALFLIVFLVTKTYNLSEEENPFANSITVSGEGEVISVPDVATFNFSIIETSESVESAQKMAKEKNNSIIEYLKEQGIEDKDLKTTGYNIYPKYEWIQELCTAEFCPPSGNRTLVGYEVNQSTSVKVRDTEKAGEILSGIGKLGASNVSGLSFEIDDEESLFEKARSLAIKDAKSKAKELSKELGIRLDKIVSFSEEDNSFDQNYRSLNFMEAGFGGESKISPTIETGENTIIRKVYVTYKIKN